MMSLKNDNNRLQKLVTSKSLGSSQTSLPTADLTERRYSISDVTDTPTTNNNNNNADDIYAGKSHPTLYIIACYFSLYMF